MDGLRPYAGRVFQVRTWSVPAGAAVVVAVRCGESRAPRLWWRFVAEAARRAVEIAEAAWAVLMPAAVESKFDLCAAL
ncbi:MAG: hypothetical protein CSA76_04230, partial [Spirochaetales bacterium]